MLRHVAATGMATGALASLGFATRALSGGVIAGVAALSSVPGDGSGWSAAFGGYSRAGTLTKAFWNPVESCWSET